MSEKPISLIDDKKSSQVTYSTDQIMDDREAQRAFFEHAEKQIAQSTELEAIMLKDEIPVLNETIWSQPDTGFVQPPEFAMPRKSHEDIMKESVDQLTDPQCLTAARTLSVGVVSLRLHF